MSTEVKPIHNKRQYTNTLVSSVPSSSSSVNPWTTSIYSSDLQLLPLRTQVVSNDTNQQKWPIVVRGRVDRSTSISSSIVGRPALIGGTTIYWMWPITFVFILIIPFLLALNIYLFISILSGTNDCNNTGDNWPLLGIIIVFLCLAALVPCSLVCWRYYWPLYGQYPYERNIELYHIERCTDPNCYWIENEYDNYTNWRMRLEENIYLGEPIPGISVSKVRRDSIAFDDGNPGIKPPNRQADEEENLIYTRQKTAKMKNGIRVTHIRSKPSLIRHRSSIIDRCPSRIVKTIDSDDDDDEISTRQKTAKVKNGIRVTHVRSKSSLTRHRSSISDRSPSRIVSPIYSDDDDEISTSEKTAEVKNGIRVTHVRSKSSLTRHRSSISNRSSSRIVRTIYSNNNDEISTRQKTAKVKNDIRVTHVRSKSSLTRHRSSISDRSLSRIVKTIDSDDDDDEICSREKTAEVKNGIRVIHVRSEPPLTAHRQSISDRSPSKIVNPIYSDNYDEISTREKTAKVKSGIRIIHVHSEPPLTAHRQSISDRSLSRIIKTIYPNNNDKISTREKTAELKNGIQVTHVRSKSSLTRHLSSISKRPPSKVVKTIYLNNNDEIKPGSVASNIDHRNTSSSSQQSIPLNETELTQDLPKPNSANNNSKILPVRTRIERIPKKIKPNKIHLETTSEIPKDKSKNRPRVKHVSRQKSFVNV